MSESANGELVERIRAFLAAHSTLTLATVDDAGQAQAAALFYAAADDLNLYLLSSPNSRHSRNLRREPRVAATIQAGGQPWQQIRGLQIEGTLRPVEGVQETAKAARIYAARFEFLRGLLAGGSDLPVTLIGPVASSRFYVLRPAWIRLIDNSRGFGHKEEWRIGE